MSIDTIKALTQVCIKIQDCLPQLATIIGTDHAALLAEKTEELIHALDNEPVDPQYKPIRKDFTD